MPRQKKTLYLKRDTDYDAYVTPHGKPGQGSRPKKILRISVPERISQPVNVRRMERRK